MNPDTHKLSGRFCPFCLRALWLHIESGFEFCPGDPECDYEVRPSTTLHPLTQVEKVERTLNNKQREHSVMLKRLGELQGQIAKLTSEMTALGFPPPAGGLAGDKT
ncbi:hypothetical protein [Aeromonas salmonicida]|uniref:hypothetical protein n=1 Tax=Aeromonas salmonicida TaxID=645 RepID=UPI00232F46F1|nr:hypothetical protein [Aeromonas salmonicida]WCH25227.1 hypothetical protein ONZ54_22905 [Aeromonas salmonicida]